MAAPILTPEHIAEPQHHQHPQHWSDSMAAPILIEHMAEPQHPQPTLRSDMVDDLACTLALEHIADSELPQPCSSGLGKCQLDLDFMLSHPLHQASEALAEDRKANILSESGEKATTVMVQNLSPVYRRDDLLQDLYSMGFGKGSFNFIYVPFNFSHMDSCGYAFINFIHSSFADAFRVGATHLLPAKEGMTLRTVPAAVQGLENNAELFLSGHAKKIRNSRFRPLILVDGELEPLTMELGCHLGLVQ
eukprot:gnl/MRDRNA2_/MRDRNA2_85685_c0_seq2.p1 gnl/MRDRNA2_/MRDRNA2_85685_c0~~gnl/MRDRNA2_/MRDRNA2_85685_c0_seq2.p1  ORF type:complete len:265 (+),score=45.47 gnl/MRDRNA2_/MRDRNA2_85685_c0_seq2:53-796(+)